MKNTHKSLYRTALTLITLAVLMAIPCKPLIARDLKDIKAAGVIRHIGVPYAGFVTGSGDGLDVEMMKLFAKHIGVKYEYVPSDWSRIFPDLLGHKLKKTARGVELGEQVPIRGDIIANGLTVIPWRQKLVNYSLPTFPTQVWLLAKADSPMRPIKPSGKIQQDIKTVKSMLKGRTMFGKNGTCLEPSLYNLEATGAIIKLFEGGVNDLAPAVIKGEAESTILDVPDALIALQKWPGQVKIIGPISMPQLMGVGFPKESKELQKEFNKFFSTLWENGTYRKMVAKYYPAVFRYYAAFFDQTLDELKKTYQKEMSPKPKANEQNAPKKQSK